MDVKVAVKVMLLQFVFMVPGMMITNYFAFKIGQQTGLTGGKILPFVLGIWLVAWSPFLPLAFQLRCWLRSLEAKLADQDAQQGPKQDAATP